MRISTESRPFPTIRLKASQHPLEPCRVNSQIDSLSPGHGDFALRPLYRSNVFPLGVAHLAPLIMSRRTEMDRHRRGVQQAFLVHRRPFLEPHDHMCAGAGRRVKPEIIAPGHDPTVATRGLFFNTACPRPASSCSVPLSQPGHPRYRATPVPWLGAHRLVSSATRSRN